jgi:hypothetical protein
VEGEGWLCCGDWVVFQVRLGGGGGGVCWTTRGIPGQALGKGGVLG